MMRQSNLLYALLTLVLITVSAQPAEAQKGLRYYKDREDSYFSEHMKPCMLATRRSKNEEIFDRSQCSACNMELGRTPFERGMFEKRLAQCLGGTKMSRPSRHMYQCGNKALCHSYVKNIRDCTKTGTCTDSDLKSCADNCTPPTSNNCIDEDKSDFQKARALCATQGAAEYELLGDAEVMRILEKRADEMYPQGGTTTLAPQSSLAKTSIFSPASEDTEQDTVTATDDEIKAQTNTQNFVPNTITTQSSNSETTTTPGTTPIKAPMLSVPINSPSSSSATDFFEPQAAPSRAKLSSESSPASELPKETLTSSSTTGEWEIPSSRKPTPASSFFPFQSMNSSTVKNNSALTPTKMIAENASANNRSHAPPGTLESSNFQSGFHKNAEFQKRAATNSHLPQNSHIKASGNGAMSLDSLIKGKKKQRRGIAQQESQWTELKGKIGTGPHPVFLGVDHYFDKIRLDFNGEIAN